MLRPYRLLAAVPHAPALMATALLARLYLPAINLVLTFLAADWTGSYAVGGALGAAITIGQAVAGPVRGRSADRAAPGKVLLITGVLFGLGLLLLVLLARHWLPARVWWLALPVAFLTGLATPPVPQVGRAVWTRIADPAARRAAFAVEATLGELVFIVGPVLAATAVAVQGPFAAGLWCAAWAALGPAGFAAVLHRAGVRAGAGEQRQAGAAGSLLAVPGMVRLLCFGGLMVGALIGIDLLLVGWARERGQPELAGLLSAVWGAGSLAGGLVLGASAARPRLWLRALAALLGFAALVPVLPPVVPGSPLVVGGVLLLGGAAIAPMLAASNSRLGELAPPHRRAEAFGWLSSATTAGGSIASPLAGALLDASGPAAAAAAVSGMAAVAVCLVAHLELRRSRSSRPPVHTAVP